MAPDVVLTAGHCVANTVVAFYTGSGRTSPGDASGLVSHDVDRQRAHPDYVSGSCPATTFDVGLVHLKTAIDGITPVSYRGKAPAVSSSCRVVGFGMHSRDDGDTDVNMKREADVTIDSIAATYFTIRRGSGVPDHGDSGGPLLCDGFVVGTCSCHTDGTGSAHQIEYMARVDEMSEWIDGAIEEFSR